MFQDTIKNKKNRRILSKKIMHLKIKKIRTMQGQYLSIDNGLIVRVNGIKFPLERGERYLTKDTAKATFQALTEYENNINKNFPESYL